jgi:leucyl aminopeptidase
MKCLALVAPVLATAAVVSGLSIDPKLSQAALQDEQPILQDRCLIELSPGETRWVSEEDKWELKRAWFSVVLSPALGG